jgi:hypothetical protein
MNGFFFGFILRDKEGIILFQIFDIIINIIFFFLRERIILRRKKKFLSFQQLNLESFSFSILARSDLSLLFSAFSVASSLSRN